MTTKERSRGMRDVVIPGQVLGSYDPRNLRAGFGTYVENDTIFSTRLGLLSERSGYVSVVPLGGRYIPRMGDQVIGMVIDYGASMWFMDLNGPYDAMLHHSETPWEVGFGKCAQFLDIGDLVLCEVIEVKENKKNQVSIMNNPILRKISGGDTFAVNPAKIPRIIGKGASMINQVKSASDCKIVVGTNGRVWVKGDSQRMIDARKVIEFIADNSHVQGLTELVGEQLQSLFGTKGKQRRA